MGCEPATGKSAVALGVRQLLARRRRRASACSGPSSPTRSTIRWSTCCARTRSLRGVRAASATRRCAPTRSARWRRSSRATGRWPRSATACSWSAPTSRASGTASELAFNARVALNLGLPALLVVSGHDRTAGEVREAISVARRPWRRWGCDVVGVVANRVAPRPRRRRRARRRDPPVYALPEIDLLMAPTVGQVAAACDGDVIAGDAGAARARGAAPHGRGDDAAEPDGADRGRRGADHARRPRRGAAGRAVRARLDRAPLPRGRRADRRAAAAGRSSSGRSEGFPTMLPVVLTEHDTFETVDAGRRARGRDRARHAAQDHEGAGGVRGARGRRRAAGPRRRRPLGGGDAADVRVHAARPRAGGEASTSCCPRAPTSACCARPRRCCAAASSS